MKKNKECIVNENQTLEELRLSLNGESGLKAKEFSKLSKAERFAYIDGFIKSLDKLFPTEYPMEEE